ncbi:hypothetical protein HW49_06020 [Porphyromonadaceae bacterium COT-184 OH4590]|nr:hypothetical protein HW49_06020 [Porphyromonadaceae bacterium COT-184 OH4590]
MKKVIDKDDIKDMLSSLSLNALLAEKITSFNDSSVVEVEYRALSCSYYNNDDHIAYSYFKDIVIPDLN